MASDESPNRGPKPSQGQAPPAPHDPRSYTARVGDPVHDDPGGDSGQDDGGKDQKGEGQPAQGQKGGGEGEKGGGKKKSFVRQHPVGVVIGLLVLIALIVIGVLYVLNARHFQTTDDAFVDTHIVRLAPRISGRVSRVLVEDNQKVTAGQPVIEIDPRDYQARLSQAQASAAQAQAQIAQAQAQLVQVNAQVRVSQSTVRQAVSSANGSQAQAGFAASDFARYENLKSINPSAVAQQQLDQSSAQAVSTAAQRDAAFHQIEQAQNQVRATASQRATALAQIAAGQAQLKNAQATIEAAQLDLSYTNLQAPVTGTVAQRTVADGNYVNAGAQVMAVVPLQVWITANFKETQLTYMRPGQSVSIHVDACGSAPVSGHVDSIQRGSGQAFGILPPENATGNFVKVVQRVPVKILIDHAPKSCILGPGMSVEPKVRVR